MAATNDKDWAGDAKNASPDGEFIRDTNYIEVKSPGTNVVGWASEAE